MNNGSLVVYILTPSVAKRNSDRIGNKGARICFLSPSTASSTLAVSNFLYPFPRISETLMSDPYFQAMFADRIGGAQYGKGTAIYKFEKIKRAKRQALAEHPERQLLDFGIGENDGVADELVLRTMAEEIGKPENRGYADNGIGDYKEAIARFMQREYGVTLDPATQINHCIGSKSGAGNHSGRVY